MPELLLVSTVADLDLRDLARAIERAGPDSLVVSRAPGLLAVEDGEPVRDRARARGATLLVVAPAGPDLVSHALLTIEAARAVGLAVAAVAVAGAGSGDGRGTVRERGGVDVVDVPDLQAPSSVVVEWPLSDWAVAEPLAPGGSPSDVVLAPYAAWEAHPVRDPRDAGRHQLDPVLLEIVAAEGPILASRAYGLYNKASGGHKLTSIARAPLSGAAYRLRQSGRIEIDVIDGEDVLRPTGSPAVRVRELGPRTLDEVPLDELAELVDRVCTAGVDNVARAVLDAYGLIRMTAKAEQTIERATDLLRAGG